MYHACVIPFHVYASMFAHGTGEAWNRGYVYTCSVPKWLRARMAQMRAPPRYGARPY